MVLFNRVYDNYLFLYYYDLIDLLTSAIEVPRIAVDATIWGVLGGILRGIWKLWTNVDQRGFRIIWRIYFFSCPFLGGLLGALLYLLIVSGLFLISQTNQTEINDVLSAQMVIMALSAVAGYNWEWAIRIFDRIGNLSE